MTASGTQTHLNGLKTTGLEVEVELVVVDCKNELFKKAFEEWFFDTTNWTPCAQSMVERTGLTKDDYLEWRKSGAESALSTACMNKAMEKYTGKKVKN